MELEQKNGKFLARSNHGFLHLGEENKTDGEIPGTVSLHFLGMRTSSILKFPDSLGFAQYFYVSIDL
jgi:hypothetical protein